MPVQTAAGSQLYIGTTAANSLTDTYLAVGEVTNLGEFGRMYEEIKYNNLTDRNVKKFKGPRDDGDISLALGRAASDVGQAAIRAALDSDFDYNFKITLNDQVTPNSSSTVTISIATPGVITWTAHGLTAGTPVVFSTTGALPTGLTAGTTYYIIPAGLTTNAFEVSATLGGSAVNTTGSQSGVQTASASPGSPTTFYFKAKVLGYRTSVGSATQVVAVSTTLAITSGSISEIMAS